MPEELELKVREWLSNCPYAEYADIDAVYDDGHVYVVTVSLAIEKELGNV